MHRSKMSKKEREWRSRLAQWVSTREMLRGTLSVRQQRCGKPRCRCRRGQKHVSLCLVQSKNGRIEQMHVPREWEDRVRQWVKQYKDARVLLEKLSDLQMERLRRRQG